MKTAKSIREERAAIIAGMNDITSRVATDNRSMNADERQEFDSRDASQAKLLEEAETIERCERSAELLKGSEVKEERSYSNHRGLTKKDCNDAFRAFFMAGNPSASMKEEYRQAAEKCGLNPHSGIMSIALGDLDEARAIQDTPQTLTTSAGGYTIQQAAMRPLENTLKFFSGARQVANIIRTNGDGAIPIPTCDDTANKGRLIALNTQVTNTAIAFGQKSLGAYKFSSDLVLVPTELIEDSSIDLPSFIGQALGERLGRIQNDYFTTGSGSGQPQGLVTGASAGVVAADDLTFTWQELFVDLPHSVDVAYRNQGCGFMMNDATLAYVKKMVDDNNRPIWMPSLIPGSPDTLCGYPVVVNNSMATIAASAVVALFGDYKKFMIRDVRNVQVQVLRERFADYDQVAYLGWYRGDSIVVNSAAVKKFTMHAGA